ncbi:hypothetical protein CMI42_03650 [Candidatus Pacearchaeota archaeon]|nr:hypothetical protein [Candidatus Pacearchaeota archaeon]
MKKGHKERDVKRSAVRREFKQIKKKDLFFGMIILALGIAAFFFYQNYLVIEVCEDMGCFKESLVNCDAASFVRADVDAVWNYEILDEGEDVCDVEVTLLRLIDGKIEMDKLQGKSMICEIYKTNLIYPEDDLSVCSGVLKEEMQDVIIKRMHDYLILNIGEVVEGFEEF